MKGRILNQDESIKSLKRKGAEIEGFNPIYINIKKCKRLGNKSWGLVDFLNKFCPNVILIGKKEYLEKQLKVT